MKVFEINSVNYGSTGKIMYSLSDMLSSNGHCSMCATGFTWKKSNRKDSILVGNLFTKALHMYLSKFSGNHGCYSRFSTKRLVKKIEAFEPDIIHLHNIHGWYINIPILFEYIKRSKIPVIWTLHDCWAFTGGCAHFLFSDCMKWKNGCGDCSNLKEYPIGSKRDKTRNMWERKKKWFTEIENLTLVTPSEWLSRFIEYSFLNEYPVKVINNGIDLSIFKPTVSRFREENGCQQKYIILGVSLGWSDRKGLDVFCELSQRLDKNKFQIVLIGTDELLDRQLPKQILSIHRTQNQQELAAIYTCADVFVNPTREDNYPTVNMEALACGTPVITFQTGGSPEMLDETCASVVCYNDVDSIEKEIVRVCYEKPYNSRRCIEKSKEFDMNQKNMEYMKLYESIITKRNTAD